MPALLAERTARGDHPLLICDDDVLTYADAAARSGALAKGLVASGVGKGTHVGLLHPNGSAFVIGWLAATRIGAVALPLSTFSTSAELRMLLRNADVEVLLAAPSVRGRDIVRVVQEAAPGFDAGSPAPLFLPEVPALRQVRFHTADLGGVDDEVLAAMEAAVSPADRMVIVHTSGSTSTPKGVIHQHGPLIRHLGNLNQLRRYEEDEVLFSNSPFFWIGGFAYSLLGTADVRPVDPELRHNMLGMTEAGSVCLASEDEGDQPERRRGSFGRPVPGFEARIVDPETGARCATGEVGELWLRSPFLMEGYYGRERHETFTPDGWYRTGDLFHVDDEGFFYFAGRRGDMIKTAGANVSPREVEAAIADATGLIAHVVGVEDPDRGQVVAAALRVPGDQEPPDTEELRASLRKRLSAYKVPQRYLALADDEVPMLSSGKLDTAALQALLQREGNTA